MNVMLNLPDEMAEQLRQIAQTNHVSVDELASAVLAGYIDEQATDDGVDYDLTPEELTELKTSIAEAEAEDVWYSQEDINQMLTEMTERYSQNRNNHAG